MSEKKIIQQSLSRKLVQQKINEALLKKPTSAFLNSRGFSDEDSKVKERLMQRKVKNGKNTKRIKVVVNASKEPKHANVLAAHKLLDSPDYFAPANDKQPDISIIVPCFKSHEYIREQIESWDLNEKELNVEIIYVDDACPFKSHEAIFDAWRKRNVTIDAKIVLNNKNGGFASTCNIGASHAKGKYLMFLNADTSCTPGWLKPMFDAIQDETIGMVGNLQLRKDGTVDSCGSEWCWKCSAFLHVGRYIHNKKRLEKPYTMETLPEDLATPRDVEMVTGACMMLRRDLFQKIGGFDTEYKIGYWEDSELNMKVHVHGYRIHFTPKSVIYHKVGHTNSGSHAYANNNRNLFHKRWVDTKIIEGYIKSLKPTFPPFLVNKDKVVVYTAITDGYDDLKDQPKKAIDGVDSVAFLEKPTSSKLWKSEQIHKEFADKNRNAKIHKVMPHIFFPDKEYSLWIDGSVRITFPFSIERLIQIYLFDCDFAVFKHPDRNCIYQEANACITRRLDDANVINNQIQRYTKEGYPSNFGLAECSVLLRRHTPKVKEFNEAWWEEIKNGSKRDQISFNYVAHKVGLKYKYFPGDLRKVNYLFKREVHKKRR